MVIIVMKYYIDSNIETKYVELGRRIIKSCYDHLSKFYSNLKSKILPFASLTILPIIQIVRLILDCKIIEQ